TATFSAPNELGDKTGPLGGGQYVFAGGNVNINAGGSNALSGVSGTMSAGTLNLNVPAALNGTTMDLSGGNIVANAANSLGSAIITMSGAGRITLKNDA